MAEKKEEPKITPEQIKCMFGMAKTLGYDKFDLRAIAKEFSGTASISQLKRWQASKLIRELEDRICRPSPVTSRKPSVGGRKSQAKKNNVVNFPAGGKRKRKETRRKKSEQGDDNTVGFVTRKQFGFIKHLAYGILKWDEKRLNGFCVKRAIGKEKPATKDEAGIVITALQKVIKGDYGKDRFQEKQ